MKSTSANSAPKVVKRKAPNPSGDVADISISRPIASKPQNGQGLIPPPPAVASVTPEVKEIIANKTETRKMSLQTADINISTTSAGPPSSPDCESIPSGSYENLITGSVESVVVSSTVPTVSWQQPQSTTLQTASPARSPAPSPKCLRPYRKIEDVTTVKRQPKTGWL